MDLLLPGAEEQVLCQYTIAQTKDSRTGEELEADGYNFLPDENVYIKFTLDGFTNAHGICGCERGQLP
mgnify:CR=1 FL=1